jgi:hypothetical protein
VHCRYRWIVEDGRVLGAIVLRYELNERLLQLGHIGYGIQPSARRRGLATWALGRMLDEARGLGPHCPADVGRWRSGSRVRYQGELLLIRQKAPSWQQVGRMRANARVQAGTSEVAGALT